MADIMNWNKLLNLGISFRLDESQTCLSQKYHSFLKSTLSSTKGISISFEGVFQWEKYIFWIVNVQPTSACHSSISLKYKNKYKYKWKYTINMKNSNNILQTVNVQSTCLRGTAHSVSRTNILQPLLVTCYNHLHYCHRHYHNPHIGHICRVFLRCDLSSVSSICLPKQMRSHIDYICAVFLQSEFSNVFSNRLP